MSTELNLFKLSEVRTSKAKLRQTFFFFALLEGVAILSNFCFDSQETFAPRKIE